MNIKDNNQKTDKTVNDTKELLPKRSYIYCENQLKPGDQIKRDRINNSVDLGLTRGYSGFMENMLRQELVTMRCLG